MLIQRRAMLLGIGGIAGSRVVAASDFWNEREAAQWSEKDIQRILRRSPWAKEVPLEVRLGPPLSGGRGGGRRGGGGGSSMSAAGDSMAAGIGGQGGGVMEPGGPGAPDSPGGGAAPVPKVTVRWESAKPVREAMKRELPPATANHYVISVLGMPGGRPGGRSGDSQEGQSPEQRRLAMEARLKEFTYLQRKGKDPIPAVRAQLLESQRAAIFLFARQGQEISVEDKDVTFVTKVGPTEIKAKFPLKDMVYQGKLEL